MGAFYVVVVMVASLHLANMAAIDRELKKSDDPGTLQDRILHWFTGEVPPPPPPPFIPPPIFPPPPPCAPMLYYDEAQDHADTNQVTAAEEERDYMYPLGPLPPCPPLPFYDDPEVKAGDTNQNELVTEPADPEASTT